MKLLKNIFSITENSIKNGDKHIIITILGIKIQIKKHYINIDYLSNKKDEVIIRHKCPLCGETKYVLKEEYEINKLIKDWKNKYAFIPIGDNYKDNLLERRVCKNCGIHYYNYLIPDTNEFYQRLTNLHPIYSKNKWDYNEALGIVQKYKPSRLLDIGCGYGYFIDKIKNYIEYVAGTEFNELAIKECTKKGIKIYDKDLSQINEKFNMITAFQVLEHVTDIKTFITNVKDLLNPNGLLLFVTPNPNSELIKYNPGILELPPHHNLDIPKETYEYIAKQNNLKIIDYKTQEIMPFDYKIYLKAKYNINYNKNTMHTCYLKEKDKLIGKSHLILFQKQQ